MLYWLYDMPTLLAVALFAVVFVGVCWIGIIWISPRLVPLARPERDPRRLPCNILVSSTACYSVCSPSRLTKITVMSKRR